MSYYSRLSPMEFWVAMDRVLGDIPHEGNRAIVKEYLKWRAQNNKQSTIGNDASHLRSFFEAMGEVALEDVTVEMARDHFANPGRMRVWRNQNKAGEWTITRKREKLAAGTKRQRVILVKRFLSWWEARNPDAPKLTVELLAPRRRNEDMEFRRKRALSKDDLRAMLNQCTDSRERVIIAVLQDTGMRAAEMGSLNVGDVIRDKHGLQLVMPTEGTGLKTGARRVRIFDSEEYLQQWLQDHPKGTDPKAPLFFSMSRRAPMRRITENALWQFTTRKAKAAGIKEKANPHQFRHTAATEKAELGWNEIMMRHYFGWSRGSNMPARYTHLSGDRVDKMMLKQMGRLDEEEKPTPALKQLKCGHCGTAHALEARFCSACNSPLSPEAEAMVLEQQKATMRELLAEEMKRMMEADDGPQ